jgi:hypothetical protein
MWVGLTLGSNGGSADDAEKAGWERKMLNKRDRASESERASERARESGERDFIRNNAHGGSWARSSDRRCIALYGQREHPHRIRGTQKRTWAFLFRCRFVDKTLFGRESRANDSEDEA